MAKSLMRLKHPTRTSIGYAVLALLIAAGSPTQAQDPARPTFSAGVAVVPITVLVRDAQNRVVRDLVRADFQVLERGLDRPIVDFQARDDAPVSVAFLFDTSGSMRLAMNLEKGIWFVQQFLNRMVPASDEAALFTFHKTLRQDVPFTRNPDQIHRALGRVNPWGLTSLYDAIAESAKRLADRPAPRKALVVVSDGVDTSSRLTAQQVSKLASSIDVPVYVVAVVSPLDGATTAAPADSGPAGNLADLAYWTGGDLLVFTAPQQAGAVSGELMVTLRQQYFLAIESATTKGWYPLEVKTKRPGLTVRARRGYVAESSADRAK